LLLEHHGIMKKHSTYIIIKKIEINIRRKLIGQNLQLTFNGFRFSKHFVVAPLGGCRLRKPLAYIRRAHFTHKLLGFTFIFFCALLQTVRKLRKEGKSKKKLLRMFYETLLECEWIMELRGSFFFVAPFASFRSFL
jgi:hypothetical protein